MATITETAPAALNETFMVSYRHAGMPKGEYRVAEVLSRQFLDALLVSPDRVPAEYRLVELPGSGFRYLARPTGKFRFFRAWATTVQDVELFEVDTGVEYHDDDTYQDRPVVVAQVGPKAAHVTSAFQRAN